MRLDGYMRIKDVAEELAVSYTTVINLIKRGELKAFKVGGQWRVRAEEYHKFLFRQMERRRGYRA